VTFPTRLAAILGLGLGALLFLHRLPELPLPDVDERSFLDIPYRFATFGDLRYPVFIAEAFGADEVRPYPPINSFAFRSAALRLAGFSAARSRYFSAGLVLLVLFASALWVRSRFGADWALTVVALTPAALAPVMILAARTTRHEQETFFFGALSALLLAKGGLKGLNSRPRDLAVAGGLATFSAGTHPFGTVYCVLAFLALLAARPARALLPWLGGALIGASSTIWWLVIQGSNLFAAATAVGATYRGREDDLVTRLSRFSSVAWLKLAGLPDVLTARFASVQHSAFDDHLGFPLEPGPLSLLLRLLFWGEGLFVAAFFLKHLRNRRVENDGPAWLAFVGLGFLAFTFIYVPNTTYGLYGSFHIHLAFAAACLVGGDGFTGSGRHALRSLGVVVLLTGLVGAGRLVDAPRAVTLDREFNAIADMARASGIRPEATVMTTFESWIAAGARNTSLFELMMYGTGTARPDAIVYRRSYLEFFMSLALGSRGEPEQRARAMEERKALVAKVHAGLRLAGWLLIDEERGKVVYFFRRGEPRGVSVSSIDPNRIIPLQTVAYGSDAALGPRVDCDTQAVPLCVFHER
jgi:hypothetical protein